MPRASTAVCPAPRIEEMRSRRVKALKAHCAALDVDTSHFVKKDELIGAILGRLGVFDEVSSAAFDANLQGFHGPVVFLDVDGVLNNTVSFPSVRLDTACCQRLVRLVSDTCARVVISSTWRLTPFLRLELAQALWRQGLPLDAFVGTTRDIHLRRRQEEIAQWLEEHPDRVTAYVVLDDTPFPHESSVGRAVWTNPEVGFSDKDLEQALLHLSAVPLGQAAERNPLRTS